MTIARLLTQDITHHVWIPGAEDELGNPVTEYEDPVTVKGYLFKRPIAEDEIVRDREVALSTWMLVLGPSVEVSHRDKFGYEDREFQVDGTVHRVWNPRTSSVHHLEIQLRLVEQESVAGS